MKRVWENDGEPDENGDIIAYIENDRGVRISTFKGKSYKEVADKLLDSQAAANAKIGKLLRPDRAPVGQPLNLKDSNLTAADRMRLVNDIQDPDKVAEAVTEIVTSAAGGVAPRDVAQITADMTQQQRDTYYRTEAEAFIQDNPDYYPVQQNRDKLFATLKANNYDLTRNNLTLVFQTLFDQNEMILWPDGENEGQPRITLPPDNGGNGAPAAPNGRTEPNPPTPTNSRPRSVSTGIRRQDASALPPAPTPRKKLTHAELASMPRAEYEARVRDPIFRKQVDDLGPA